jgi:transcription elongation factor GreA
MVKYLTQEAYEKLKQEYSFLVKAGRKEIAERIKVAKSFGDLSENAEYKEALEAQRQLEQRIFQLEKLLKEAKIVKNRKSVQDEDKITLGSQFEVKNIKTGKKQKFTLVSFTDVDPLAGKISPESPLGAAFLNKKKGELVELTINNKKQTFQILKVN